MVIIENQDKDKSKNQEISQAIVFYNQHDPSQWIKSIAQIFDNNCKISINWLLFFKNKIAQIIDYQIVEKLASG